MLARLGMSLLNSFINKQSQSGVLYFHRVLKTPDPFCPDDPTIEEFDRLLGTLKHFFDITPLASEPTKNKPKLHITFDDGYLDNYHNALPILKKHGLKATFFIATAGISEGFLWQDELAHWFRHADESALVKLPSIDNSEKALSPLNRAHSIPLNERAAHYHRWISKLKFMSIVDRQSWLGLIYSTSAPHACTRIMMTTDMLKHLEALGHEIGAHTHTHTILSTLSDQEAKDEILRSRDELEHILEKAPRFFAYPNGLPERDFTQTHQKLVADAGFIGAFSTADGGIGEGSSRLCAPRFLPYRRQPLLFSLSTAKIMGEKIT
jgi:peptidoglycan/xylan/chitin deacetylase (PgdA/CDA1 family)